MRLSQSEIAQRLGCTQGHYSKVIKGKAPLSPKLSARMKKWVKAEGVSDAEEGRKIVEKCIELMHMVERFVGSKPG